MIRCTICGKLLRTTAGLRRHTTLLHKDHDNGESINNSDNHHNNNGNGIEGLRDEVATLKSDVEQIKWSMPGFVKFTKRKKMNEEELTESRGNFADCINELKMRFGEVESK